MTATPIEQLKREALAGLDRLDATLVNMPPLLDDEPLPKIVTTHVYPPIPIRTFDWCAYFDGEEEDGNYGYGATRAEAIADFVATCVEDDRVSPAEALRLIDEATNA